MHATRQGRSEPQVDKALKNPLYRDVAVLVFVVQLVGIMLLIKRLSS